MARVFFAALVMAFSTVLCGCGSSTFLSDTGTAVRLPALVVASDGVKADAKRGVPVVIADESQRANAYGSIESFFLSLSKDNVDVFSSVSMPSWPFIEDAASRGIDARESAGEIGGAVSESLRERLKNFKTSLLAYVRPRD